MRSRFLALGFSLGAVANGAALSSSSTFQDACTAISQSYARENVTIWFSEYVPASTNLTFDGVYANASSCDTPTQLVPVDLCRVAMKVVTSNISEISLEAWLPVNWTGRFLSTGNGGLGGCIQYTDIAYATSYGFAAVGANNGHNGTSGEAFYQNSEVVADFAYRSIHTGVVIGKDITQAFYGQNYTKSYYLGCSTGGRQGIKSAEDFPDDFDGIVAGAPAVAFNNLTSWSGHYYLFQKDNTSASFIPLTAWTMIHEEVLKQCDGIDGAVDGIIEDTLLCNFRPQALQCPPGNSTNCLTSAQVENLAQIIGPYYGVNGSLIYPRFNPGNEEVASYIYYSVEPFPYTSDWFRYAIFEDPSWEPATLTVEDAAIANAKNPSDIQTWKGDLSAFQSHGGKLLHYHGSQDNIISSENSPRYYDHVSTTMGLPVSSLDEFYRFFRISGMEHCSGGPGAWQIGQNSEEISGLPQDPQHNILLRIIDWVENGNAPETLTGTKFVNDTVEAGVKFTRNHCKYPLRNYCASGNYTDPNNWECIV